MGARPLFVLKDACRPLYPIGFVISTQCASHRESIQNRENERAGTPGSLRRDWLRILPSNEHGHHDGNKRSHHGRKNRLPPVQPRQCGESHLQSATIEKRIGGRQFFAFAKADLYSRGTSASAGCCGPPAGSIPQPKLQTPAAEPGAGTACFPFLIPSHKNAWFISRTKLGIMLGVSAFKNICWQLMKVVFR